MTTFTRTVLTFALVLATLAGTALSAQAQLQPDVGVLRSHCEARDGTLHTGYGYHRCFGARVDGRGQFTAAASVCERARGTHFAWARTPHAYHGPGRGTWICSIS